MQLQKRIADSRHALRTQWYFQADFETRYYTFVLDVLTPRAFTTRFYFLTGINITNSEPVAEFLVEARF